MKFKDITIILIDDLLTDEQAPFQRLKEDFKEIKTFGKPEDAVDFIKKNLNQKIIIVLDFQFPQTTGAIVLRRIREEISYLIPVVLLTEQKVNQEQFAELINYKTNQAAGT